METSACSDFPGWRSLDVNSVPEALRLVRRRSRLFWTPDHRKMCLEWGLLYNLCNTRRSLFPTLHKSQSLWDACWETEKRLYGDRNIKNFRFHFISPKCPLWWTSLKKTRLKVPPLFLFSKNLRLHYRPPGKTGNNASLKSSHIAMGTIPVVLPRLRVNLSIISR